MMGMVILLIEICVGGVACAIFISGGRLSSVLSVFRAWRRWSVLFLRAVAAYRPFPTTFLAWLY